MPRTVEHIVETHQLAAERRDAGLPIWDRKIRLGGIFHAEHLDFGQRRDAIVTRLRRSAWLAGRDEMDDLVLLVDELAEAEDNPSFNDVWDGIYDTADLDRVWIETR